MNGAGTMRKLLAILAVLAFATPVIAPPAWAQGMNSTTPHSGIGICASGDVVSGLRANAPPICVVAPNGFPLTADSSAAGYRITNLGVNTTTGDALSQGQSHLNDLAAATAAYSMGGNALTNATLYKWIDATESPYNATGNGTTNDSGALQAAFNVCQTAGGGMIILPPGNYFLGDPATTVNLAGASNGTSQCILQGSGVGRTIISGAGAPLLRLATQSVVRDLTVEASAASTATIGVDLDQTANTNNRGVSNWLIENVVVAGSSLDGVGVECKSCLQGTLHSANISGWNVGLQVDPWDDSGTYYKSNANLISGNTFDANNIGVLYNPLAIDDGRFEVNVVEANSIDMVVEASHLSFSLAQNHFEAGSPAALAANTICHNPNALVGLLVCGGNDNTLHLESNNFSGFGANDDIWLDSSTTSLDTISFNHDNLADGVTDAGGAQEIGNLGSGRISLSYNCGGGSPCLNQGPNGQLQIFQGPNSYKQTLQVINSGGTVVDAMSSSGSHEVGVASRGGFNSTGSIVTTAIGLPAAPSVTVNTTGSTSYTYYCVALDLNGLNNLAGGLGDTLPSSGTTVTNGAATPNNTVTCAGKAGALGFVVLKNATNAALGNCITGGSGASCSVTDTGQSTTSYTANSYDETGIASLAGALFANSATNTTVEISATAGNSAYLVFHGGGTATGFTLFGDTSGGFQIYDNAAGTEIAGSVLGSYVWYAYSLQLHTGLTFSQIGTCNAGADGKQIAITDSTVNTWGSTITGGGSDPVLAYCDGTNWTVLAK